MNLDCTLRIFPHVKIEFEENKQKTERTLFLKLSNLRIRTFSKKNVFFGTKVSKMQFTGGYAFQKWSYEGVSKCFGKQCSKSFLFTVKTNLKFQVIAPFSSWLLPIWVLIEEWQLSTISRKSTLWRNSPPGGLTRRYFDALLKFGGSSFAQENKRCHCTIRVLTSRLTLALSNCSKKLNFLGSNARLSTEVYRSLKPCWHCVSV